MTLHLFMPTHHTGMTVYAEWQSMSQIDCHRNQFKLIPICWQ